MKARDWEMYVYLTVFPLLAFPGIYAAQEGNGKTACEPVGKTRSEAPISGERAWEPAGTGVTHQIMRYDGQVMLMKAKFEKGVIETPHTHYHTQTTYMASGKFEFTVGNEKKIVETGDSIYIEPDILHSCICLEPDVLIDCFVPMKADFSKQNGGRLSR